LWLALLAPSLVLSNGRWQLAIAALAMPFLARLFLFSQPVARGLAIFLLLQIAAYLLMWREIIPAPGVLYYIVAGAYGVCYFLPFVIDRVVAGRIAGFAGTLVLPLSWYLVEILIQLLTPYGSWSSAGYTQMGHGLLTPLAAWVGVAGVAFVAIWVPSVASWLVMATAPSMRRRAMVSALFVGAMVVIAWAARTPFPDETRVASSVEVAAITPMDEGIRALDRAVQTMMQSGSMDAESLARIGQLSSELNDQLLAHSREAALAGAGLVVWSETAGHVLDSELDEFIDRGRELAREHQLYQFMGLGIWHPGSQPPLENKVVAVTPSGEVAWQYHKARPIVGSEAPFLPPGHNELPILDTPFGRVGLVICHDLDFADFVAKAGRKEVDLLLAPSADWSVIADLHAKMGVMRAVENGFWLLRPAYAGLSVIASPQGQVTLSAYDAELEGRVMSGRIPVMRNRTLYPHVRSYLPLIAVSLLAGLLVLAWRKGSP
jgi:apolipoprotein N-acyltransferase